LSREDSPGVYVPGVYESGVYEPGVYEPGVYEPGVYEPGVYVSGVHESTAVPTTRRQLRQLEAAQAARAAEAARCNQPPYRELRPPAQPVVRRRDLRLALRANRIATRVRRIRSATRLGLVAMVGAILVPGAIVGGVAYALTSSDAGDMTLRPGSSATAEAGTSFTDGWAGATFVLPGRPAGDSLYLGLELRRSGGSLYRTKARVFPDGSVSVDLSKVLNNGAEQFLGTKLIQTAIGTDPTTVTLQGQVSGTTAVTVAVRAWVAGSVKPDWQLSVADPTPIGSSGSVRVWSYLSRRAAAPISFHYQDLTAKAAGSETAPSPTPSGPSGPTATPTPAPTTPAPTKTTAAPTTAPSSPAGSPGMNSVLAKSGADLDTDYTIPAGAIFVAPGGSNSDSGSKASPVGSIATAIAKAPSGGTVVLRGGTYRQSVGDVNKRLTIQAYPHEYPVLSGADAVTGWSGSGGLWRATSWTSPFAQNAFRPDEVPAGTAAGKVEQTYRNGKALKQVLTLAELKSGTFWINPTTRQLYVADDPTNAVMEVSNRDRGMTLGSGATGSKILGLRFTAYAGPHLDNGSELYVGSNDTLIQNSQFDHSSSAGLKIAGTNITVDHITAAENAAEGMNGNRNDNSVVENNQFVRNNTDRFKSVGCAMSCTVAGFKTAHTANLVVKNNAFVDNVANGFWCDLGCTNATITGNAVTGSYDGLFYEVSSHALISNNYVEDSDKGIRVSGSDHVTITGNTLVDNNFQLTVYDDRRSSSTDAYSAGLGLSWNTTNLVIADNTIKGGGSTTKLLEANGTAQVASPQMFSKLADNTNSGTQVMVWCTGDNKCKTYASIADWKAASGLSF
jgi:Right handed beta helix region